MKQKSSLPYRADFSVLIAHWFSCSYVSIVKCSHLQRATRVGDMYMVDSSWNVMAHGDTREGKWRGNWRMEWVASTLHTTSEHGVSIITTADAHTSAASSRLNWSHRWFKWTRPFCRKRNLVSACVPSHFNWPLHALRRRKYERSDVLCFLWIITLIFKFCR